MFYFLFIILLVVVLLGFATGILPVKNQKKWVRSLAILLLIFLFLVFIISALMFTYSPM